MTTDGPARYHENTNLVFSWEAALKNVTISMDEELARAARVEAAKAGKSMSRYIADVVETALRRAGSDKTEADRDVEAIERFLAGPKLRISENGRMPIAEERNARR